VFKDEEQYILPHNNVIIFTEFTRQDRKGEKEVRQTVSFF